MTEASRASLRGARPRLEASYSGVVFDVVLPVVQVLLAAFLTLLTLGLLVACTGSVAI